MKRNYLLWIVPWIALGLSACATFPKLETAKACAKWRWIGIKGQGETECPPIPGWKANPLFCSMGLPRPDYGKENPAATTALQQLERFCVYETNKKFGAPFPPTANGKLVRMDQDCAAVAVAAETGWKPFSERFLYQAGATPLAIKNQRGVRLAFLDTHPTGVGVPTAPPTGKGVSEHGYTLTHIARNLICGHEAGDDCAALITTRLALPITKFNPKSRKFTKIDTENGGHIGMQTDLAEAIRNEVDAWRDDLQKEGAPQHLVLNLSVAWNGDLFGGLREEQIAELRAGAQAVYWALRYAASFDVLVLAAAGNAQDCKSPSEGPLLPAAWETGAPRDEIYERSKTPLLYAVGGVDAQGRLLANARNKAMPPRAAYAKLAVVPALTPGHSTNMYTGTSVATAVVSSTAAIVWDTLPDNDSRKIMEILERSGENLSDFHADLHANFGSASIASSGAAAPPVRRISLCTALEAACKEPGAIGCPLKSHCDLWRPELLSSCIDVPLHMSKCHPWVHTQPPDEPCPICEPPRN
jgi:hypothetical protein